MESGAYLFRRVVMELKIIDYELTVCKIDDPSMLDLGKNFYFIGKTDEELSLVCKTEDTPDCTTERDDEYNGATKYGETKGGHIKGAVFVPYLDLFQKDGTLKTNDEITAI